MKESAHVIGVDFGSDSVRVLVVNAADGAIVSSAVSEYRRWKAGAYCCPERNRYRQHPQDYIDALQEAVRDALSRCDRSVADSVAGISFDTTASTPVLTDRSGTPLALLPAYRENPDAMFILWKDHTAIAEAEAINRQARRWPVDYTKYSGGVYSCEWVWAKMLHALKSDLSLLDECYSWVEHCDWIGALLTGDTTPERIARSRCAAGHKAMWHEEWGGLPDPEFLSAVDPLLNVFRGHLYSQTCTGDCRAGTLCGEWAERLGLPEGIAVGVGAIDCHVGAVGAGIEDHVLVKVMGTSTCDILMSDYASVGSRAVPGICGQVDGAVVPGKIGFEAGQSAFGDVYAWFRRLLAWPLRNLAGRPELESGILEALTREAERLPLTAGDPVAVDWFNGRRTPDADPLMQGALSGLTLATSAPAFFKALVEATAFGARAINERMEREGIRIDAVIAVGGIAGKSRFVMQTLADVIGMPIRVARCGQACALGAAMYAATAAGIYGRVEDAQAAMSSGFDREYVPDRNRHEIYDRLYARYVSLGNSIR